MMVHIKLQHFLNLGYIKAFPLAADSIWVEATHFNSINFLLWMGSGKMPPHNAALLGAIF